MVVPERCATRPPPPTIDTTGVPLGSRCRASLQRMTTLLSTTPAQRAAAARTDASGGEPRAPRPGLASAAGPRNRREWLFPTLLSPTIIFWVGRYREDAHSATFSPSTGRWLKALPASACLTEPRQLALHRLFSSLASMRQLEHAEPTQRGGLAVCHYTSKHRHRAVLKSGHSAPSASACLEQELARWGSVPDGQVIRIMVG